MGSLSARLEEGASCEEAGVYVPNHVPSYVPSYVPNYVRSYVPNYVP